MAERLQGKVEDIAGVRIERNPSSSRLAELGVRSWPTWSCDAGRIPWTFKGRETCYLVRGKVKVQVGAEGTEAEASFEIGGGDLAIFPSGMTVVWDVVQGVEKHYSVAHDAEF